MTEKEMLNSITSDIIGAAIEVHRALGPGLLESAYMACLAYELRTRGRKVETEVPVPIVYKDIRLECGYRLDMRVDDLVIVEGKATEKLVPINEVQLHSHIKLANIKVGLLINFNVLILKNGIKRIVNNFPD